MDSDLSFTTVELSCNWIYVEWNFPCYEVHIWGVQLRPEFKFSWLWKLLQAPGSVMDLRAPPTLPMAQDPISAPRAISPCPSNATAGPVSSFPQPCPAWPWVPQDIPLPTVLLNHLMAMADQGCLQYMVQCNTCPFTVINLITSYWGWWKKFSCMRFSARAECRKDMKTLINLRGLNWCSPVEIL